MNDSTHCARSRTSPGLASPASGRPSWRGFFAPRRLVLLAALLVCADARAFPPAPHHLLYGMVRDEMGNPLSLDGARVILEAANGAGTAASVVPGLEPGVNYKLAVPLDSGVTSDAYRSTAVRAAALFKLRVQIGQTVYLPIEMSGEFSSLGRSAESTRINLTLGEDANGNGLPDAWERAMLAAANSALTEVNPNDDLDEDGLTNLQEYQAGTVAFDSADGFSLKMVEMKAGAATVEFMGIRGRSYSVFASPDLISWQAAPFRIGGDSSDRSSYQAGETKVVRVSVNSPPGQPALRFFKLRAE